MAEKIKKSKKEKRSKKNREELAEIAEVTEETGKKIRKNSKAFWTDFKKFAIKGNIVDLAIAVVVGAAFNKIVSSLVSCIITPLTAMLLPTGNLNDMKWVLREAVEANEELGIKAVSEVAVTYGQFLQATIDFIVIALSLYVVIKTFLKIKNAFNKKEREAAEAKVKALEEKKKAEAAEEAARQEKIRREFIEDVAVQADILTEMRDIMLRFEKKLDKAEENAANEETPSQGANALDRAENKKAL